MMRKGIIIILTVAGVALLVGLNGCLNSSSSYYDFNKILFEDIETISDYLDANGIDATLDSTTGIFVTIHDHPGGYKPAKGGIIKVYYQGVTLSGIEFGGTGSTGVPLAYPLSRGPDNGMTLGFDLGIASISEGDSATLYVPSPLCYQDKETGVVPANSILVYHVRFTDIHLLEEDIAKIDDYIVDHGMTPMVDSKYGTRYVIHRYGSGDLPKAGDAVSVHYVGELLNGTEFDSSYPNNTPLDFFFGNESVIIGFELGLLNLHEGDSATFFIPSTYGYQDREVGNIPANSVLVFGVDKIRYEGN